MSYCGFYEPGGLQYWCNKVERNVGWEIWDKYCTRGGNDCPYLDDKKCFLTTACIKAKKLPDDCKELQTLRNFRDTFLKLQPYGQKEIDLYYKIAPRIVSAINQLPNCNEIYHGIYNDIIAVCVDLIEKGEYNEAYQVYKNAVSDLKALYIK